MHERLANPIESLENTIKLFSLYQKNFSSQIPSTADIGLIQIDSKSARTKIQPTPERYIKQINEFIPVEIKKRNQKCKQWLTERIRELSKPTNNVEEFVEQSGFYKYADDHFQDIRDQVDMLGQVYNVMSNFNLKVKKEDKDAFNDSMAQISQLSNIMQNVESSQESNKENYKKTLNQLIPALDKEINGLFDVARGEQFLQNSDKFEMLRQLEEIETSFK
jgi:predicted RNA-binding protein Jag